MNKLKFRAAAAILSLAVLSGCGMARDGYIEDPPAETLAPVETPFVTGTPRSEKKPAENGMTDDGLADETPLPAGTEETAAPNM